MIFIVIFLLILLILLSFKYFHKSKILKDLDSTLKKSFNISGVEDNIVQRLKAFIEDTSKKIVNTENERRRLEDVLKGLWEGILIADINGTINFANRAFCKMLSTDEQITGKKFIEVTRDIKLINIFQKSIELKKELSDEISLLINQKENHFVITAIPLFANNSITDVVITLHDITKLKQLEKVRKDFVANVSHEIKTPLTAIKGFAETLANGAIDDRNDALRFINMIINHSNRLNSLVEDLLALSRIELGDIKMNFSLINIDDLVDTAFITLKEKAEKKGLYLKKIIPPAMGTIWADKDKLMQILLNLVENGIKFTEKGGVTVGIDDSNNGLIFYVQDTGIGVPQNDLNRLGERFYRVDRARSRELGGTGLGLAIVKHLVQAHGWKMNIESELGKGTRVNIILSKEDRLL
jgi:two-component system phosphate regulon sensor histidine kinase PhoR